MRWVIKLSVFRYDLEHLRGDALGSNSEIMYQFQSFMVAPMNPGVNSELDRTSFGDMISPRKSAKENHDPSFKQTDEG